MAASRSLTAMATWSISVSSSTEPGYAAGIEARGGPRTMGGHTETEREAMPGSVLVAGARTPIGKLSGALASLSAADLGGLAIAAALRRAGVSPESVDAVLLGQVILAGTGQMPARQAAVKGGIPLDTPSTTVNKACLSGLDTIAWADQMISLGQAEIVVAGGMESMTNAPHVMLGGRAGYKAGDVTLHDALFHDRLDCGLEHCSIGLSTQRAVA